MAAPNIVNVSSIIGKTSVQVITTTPAAIIENTAGSSKVLKVNTLLIANINGTNSADITVDLYRNSTAYHLIYTKPVAADSNLDLLNKIVYLEEGDALRLTASADSHLEAICSYEEIN